MYLLCTRDNRFAFQLIAILRTLALPRDHNAIINEYNNKCDSNSDNQQSKQQGGCRAITQIVSSHSEFYADERHHFNRFRSISSHILPPFSIPRDIETFLSFVICSRDGDHARNRGNAFSLALRITVREKNQRQIVFSFIESIVIRVLRFRPAETSRECD